MNEQMFAHDLELEVMIHDGEGRIYSAFTFETIDETKYIRLYLALKKDQRNLPRPYWTSNAKSAYKTMDARYLGAMVKDLLKFTDYKVVYIAEKDHGLITCLDNPRLDKKKGG